MNVRNCSTLLKVFVCMVMILSVSLAFAAQGPHSVTENEPLPSLEQMAGQMLLIGFKGDTVNESSPIIKDIRAGRVGGVVLFNYDVLTKTYDRNIKSPEQLRALTADLQGASDQKLIISIDQEGGRVQRLRKETGFIETVSAQEIGDNMSGKFATEQGRIVAKQLAEFGINVNFAPVMDLNVNPKSPAIGALGRSFSEQFCAVYGMADAFIAGMHEADVVACVKHFPGHGSSTSDSHLGVTDVTATWTEDEIIPYQMLVMDGYTDMIMTAHIYNEKLDKQWPATLSSKVVNGLLRKELGFDGVVISDDLQMKAIAGRYSLRTIVKQALLADVDILLFGNNLDYDPEVAAKVVSIIVDLVQSGEIKRDKIVKSYRRIAKIKYRLP